MDIDKKTILAFFLIFLVLIAVQYFFAPKQIPKADKTNGEQPIDIQKPDNVEENGFETKTDVQKQKEIHPDSLISLFNISPATKEQEVKVETNNYYAVLTNKGATIQSWQLKKYAKPNSVRNGDIVPFTDRVELIGPLEKNDNYEIRKGYGNLGVYLPVKYGQGDTSPLLFTVNKTDIKLTDESSTDSLIFYLAFKNGGFIKKKFIFYADKYDFDFKLDIENLTDEIIYQPYYRLEWQSGLVPTEFDIEDDMNYAKAYALIGSELEKEDIPDEGEKVKPLIGKIDWIATTTKYFTAAIIPTKNNSELKAYLSGEKIKIDDREDLYWKKYNISLETPVYAKSRISSSYKVYLGPLDYFTLKKYNLKLEKLIYLGWDWLRQLAIGILYAFVFLHKYISNYGIVIIVFSILVKIVLHPLTKKSMDSMKRMQSLKPEMDAIKEKYGNDPQRMNKETMRLYKEKGINPAAGCLPLILQFPILITLYQVFRTTIELRGEPFIFWIKDLSMPDTIFHLPFSIPFYGDQFNVLPIIMGVTMFIQQKMSVQDPKQKAMVYIMPVFFTALFNRFSSGLNLYYTLFNLFSVIQQKYFPPQKKDAGDSNTSPTKEIQKPGRKISKVPKNKNRRKK